MLSWIEQDLTSLAFLWRLERRDGVTLGFTSHDRDMEVDGLRYRAAPGMLPSAVERSSDFDGDTVELSGALTNDAIRADDLTAGRWDGAALNLTAVNWEAPALDPIYVTRGELGSVEVSGERFGVELRGVAAVFDAAVAEQTSPDCRAQLGDKRCRVDMAGRRRFVRVLSVADALLTLDASFPQHDYGFGLIHWVEGANSGLENRVLVSNANTLTLDEPPAFAVTGPVRVEIIEGCDKRFSTCVGRFANAANFRGEPHLPGNDLLTRYAS